MVERNGPIEILLVEDNPGDVRLTKEALKEGKVYSNLHTVKDGVEAIWFILYYNLRAPYTRSGKQYVRAANAALASIRQPNPSPDATAVRHSQVTADR